MTRNELSRTRACEAFEGLIEAAVLLVRIDIVQRHAWDHTDMIFIVVKFETKPDWTERWPSVVEQFTNATRAEPGNLWFEWSRSLENPAVYVLVEAFRDADAGAAHVNSDHFKQAQKDLPQALASTPRVISETIEATDWSDLAEMKVD
jgi:quinol monooxygenase YgiN